MTEERSEMLARLILSLWIEGKSLGMTEMPSIEACIRILDIVVPIKEEA